MPPKPVLPSTVTPVVIRKIAVKGNIVQVTTVNRLK
jgi:hypothetical protein